MADFSIVTPDVDALGGLINLEPDDQIILRSTSEVVVVVKEERFSVNSLKAQIADLVRQQADLQVKLDEAITALGLKV